MPENFYQTVNFHFQVEFSLGNDEIDIRFQSVSGLDSTLETEPLKEGGENRYEHAMPVRRKYGPLILKRGLIKPSTKGVGISVWLKEAFDNEKMIVLPTVLIKLLNEEHEPLMTWTINNVWPRSWKMAELNAMQGDVLIETLELNYNRLVLT
jgi:phage tail-like protein